MDYSHQQSMPPHLWVLMGLSAAQYELAAAATKIERSKKNAEGYVSFAHLSRGAQDQTSRHHSKYVSSSTGLRYDEH